MAVNEDKTEEMSLRVTHIDGEVVIDGIEGVKAIKLDPVNALRIAGYIVRHADLAAEQRLAATDA